MTNPSSVSVVVNTVDNLSDGWGATVEQIITTIRSNDSSVSPEAVMSAIASGLQSGELARPMGDQGLASMIAISSNIRSYLDATNGWEFTGLGGYMDNLERLEDNVPAWILAGNIETMVAYGYLQANDKLQIRRSPQLVWQ